jgi:Hsp70 protein
MSSVVGVDFGYQNSVIAAAGRGGVDVILNGNSNRLNPYVQLIVVIVALVFNSLFSTAIR